MAKKEDEVEETKQEPSMSFGGGEEEEKKEEGMGSKIISVLIVLIIIVIWLGIFGVLVKADIGGFGSSLAPVLGDVPVINKILPEGSNKVDTKGYDYTLEEAIAKIKELEMKLDSQSSSSGVDSNYIEQLEAEVKRLQVFEKQYNTYVKQKKEFDKEVVYADNAPDISEYQKYYEMIDPDNAAELYRQVIEELQYSQKVQDAAKRYSEMDPATAAKILDEMTAADLDMVCAILDEMKADKSGAILAAMDSNIAAKVTKRMLSKD